MGEAPPEGPEPIKTGSVVDDFEFMEQIGSGAFSHVYLTKHKPTENFVAAKVVDLDKLKEDELMGMLREVSVFMQIEHPNICNLYRITIHGDQLVFFMECAPRGSLLDYVNAKSGLVEFEAQRLFIQIFSAIRYMHIYHFLVHRDLKLENLLLDAKGNIKVTDFGLAGTYYNNSMRTFVGTAGYQPPEILAGNEYDEKCDVWSLGICLYAMLTASLPFAVQNHNYKALVQEASDFVYPPKFSPALQDLLRKMLEVRPSQRPSMIQLQSHPWLKGLQQLGTNIAPSPIIFYKVQNTTAIAKFKRKPRKPDPKIIAQCGEIGINVEQLTDDLSKGLINTITTTYYLLQYPLKTKPEIKPPPPQRMPMPPVIPGKEKKSIAPVGSNKLTGSTNPAISSKARKGSVPLNKTTAISPLAAANTPKAIRPVSNKSNPILSGNAGLKPNRKALSSTLIPKRK